jgi:hypothetical protein
MSLKFLQRFSSATTARTFCGPPAESLAAGSSSDGLAIRPTIIRPSLDLNAPVASVYFDQLFVGDGSLEIHLWLIQDAEAERGRGMTCTQETFRTLRFLGYLLLDVEFNPTQSPFGEIDRLSRQIIGADVDEPWILFPGRLAGRPYPRPCRGRSEKASSRRARTQRRVRAQPQNAWTRGLSSFLRPDREPDGPWHLRIGDNFERIANILERRGSHVGTFFQRAAGSARNEL